MQMVEIYSIEPRTHKLPIKVCCPGVAEGSELSPGGVQSFQEAKRRFRAQFGIEIHDRRRAFMPKSRRQIASETILTIDDIKSLVSRIYRKDRGDPLPMPTVEAAVGQFTSAMQTALGDNIGWEKAERVLLHSEPAELLEHILATFPIKYPETIQKGRPGSKRKDFAVNDINEVEVAEAAGETREARGRPSQLAGARLYYEGDNPRRPGSLRHTAVELILDNPGITVEEFEAKGGRRQEVLYEIKNAPDKIRVELQG